MDDLQRKLIVVLGTYGTVQYTHTGGSQQATGKRKKDRWRFFIFYLNTFYNNRYRQTVVIQPSLDSTLIQHSTFNIQSSKSSSIIPHKLLFNLPSNTYFKNMSTLIIITGASRGIGRAIAVAFAKESRIKNPAFCLIARNKDALSQTESLIKREIEDGNNCNNEGGREKQVRSSSHSIDLSKLDTLANEIKSVFRQQIEGDTNVDGNGNGNGNVITDPVSGYERAILINNAGSLGHVGSSSDLPSPQELQANVDFNVTSTIWLSSYFVKYFAHEHQIKCNVVNISSLCAITPFKTMAMYCAGKAAVS